MTTVLSFILSAVLLSGGAHASLQLRGGRMPESLLELSNVRPAIQSSQPRGGGGGRSLQESGKTLIITNNCQKDITHFKAMYNTEYIVVGDRWQVTPGSDTGTVSLNQGESISIDGVESDSIHFYALHADYIRSIDGWDVVEVATAPELSNMYKQVTFNNNDEQQFPIYMEEISDDMKVDLCGSKSETMPNSDNEPVSDPAPAGDEETPPNRDNEPTSDPPPAGDEETPPNSDNEPTSDPPPADDEETPPNSDNEPVSDPAPAGDEETLPNSENEPISDPLPAADDEDALTIVNDCNIDITNFMGQYNIDTVQDPSTGIWELEAESTGKVSIEAEDKLIVEGFTGEEFHFYALHAVYDGDIGDTVITQVATTTETSDFYTGVMFTKASGTEEEFPFYVAQIDSNNKVLTLCGGSN